MGRLLLQGVNPQRLNFDVSLVRPGLSELSKLGSVNGRVYLVDSDHL